MRSVQTFPSEVGCSQRGKARSFSDTDVICYMPPACWRVFLSNVMRARRWRKALGKYTNPTSRAPLAGERKGTPTQVRALAHPRSTPGATGTTGGCLIVPPHEAVRGSG